MRYQIKNIPLSHIILENSTYQITTETDSEKLTESIKMVGVIQPPLLMKKNQKSEFIIVSGFRRIAACRSLGWSDIDARILNSDTKKIECVQLAITENALQRPLNLIEISRALNLLSGFFQNHQQLSETALKLGLPGNFSVIRKITSLSLLPLPIQNAILSDTISLAIALDLGNFDPNTGIAFATLFDDLKLSLNKQREIITLVKEIALREDIDMMEVLQEDALKQILQNNDFDRNQKTKEIRAYLKLRRFPAITHAEKTFEMLVKDMKLGNNIRLTPPKDFEGNLYNLTFYFRNFKDLETDKATFDNLIQNPILKKILEM